MKQGRFTLDVRENIFMEVAVNHWNRLRREMMESSLLKVLKKCRAMALEDIG